MLASMERRESVLSERPPDARRFRTTRAGHPEWLIQAAAGSWRNWRMPAKHPARRSLARSGADVKPDFHKTRGPLLLQHQNK